MSPKLSATRVTTTRIVTTRKFLLKVDEQLILALLRNAGVKVPSDAEVHFRVPGGGDWSNTVIEISKEDPVQVTWKDENEQDEEDELEILLEKIQRGGV